MQPAHLEKNNKTWTLVTYFFILSSFFSLLVLVLVLFCFLVTLLLVHIAGCHSPGQIGTLTSGVQHAFQGHCCSMQTSFL